MPQRAERLSTVAEIVREACLDAALNAYEDAGIRGLCPEGRWEAALGAIRGLVLSDVLEASVGPVSPDVTEPMTD